MIEVGSEGASSEGTWLLKLHSFVEVAAPILQLWLGEMGTVIDISSGVLCSGAGDGAGEGGV